MDECSGKQYAYSDIRNQFYHWFLSVSHSPTSAALVHIRISSRQSEIRRCTYGSRQASNGLEHHEIPFIRYRQGRPLRKLEYTLLHLCKFKINLPHKTDYLLFLGRLIYLN